jgi:putative ABC transport system ATP-binding protein
VLIFRNITKSFETLDGAKTIFNQFNLSIDANDFVSIIGTNGAGKSTLVKLLIGDLPLDDGDIFLNGTSLGDLPAFKRKLHIAKVYQDPTKGTAGNMTILENMALADGKGKPYGLKMSVNKKRIAYYRDELKTLNLGLEDQLHTNVSELSGGQRQALALIMATMKKPEILVLDEHTSALDPKTAQIVMEKTKELVERHQIPALMITHNMDLAMQYGNRLIKLDNGQIVIDERLDTKMTIDKDQLFS